MNRTERGLLYVGVTMQSGLGRSSMYSTVLYHCRNDCRRYRRFARKGHLQELPRS